MDRHPSAAELDRLESRLRQSQRLESLGTLTGGIAHEFNNILGAVLGYGERVRRDLPRDSRLRRDVDKILAATERGRLLVERLLAFSRGGTGERTLVRVEAVVSEALDLVRATLPANIALTSVLRTDDAEVHGDPTRVHQLVMDLVSNAVHAMPAGGPLDVSLLPLQLDEQRLATIGSIPPGDYLVLEVRDSGTGIEPGALDRIFDPFFTTKEVGTGTGLGLSLVHGIVLDMDGAIDVATEVGHGSVFTVYLPRARTSAAAANQAR